MSAYVPALFALLGTILGASLTAIYAYVNAHVVRRIKQQDLFRLIKAELINLERHCRLTASELPEELEVTGIRKAKYKDTGMMALDVKELYILNENLCQDLMTLILYVRNNDIELDEMLELIKAQRDNQKLAYLQKRLQRRLNHTASICTSIVANIGKYSKNPNKYDEPLIRW